MSKRSARKKINRKKQREEGKRRGRIRKKDQKDRKKRNKRWASEKRSQNSGEKVSNDDLIREAVRSLEIKIERTSNRIRIAESKGMKTLFMRISRKIDEILLNMCYRYLCGAIFTVRFNGDG